MNSMNWNRGMLIYFRMDDCGWSSLSTFPPFHLSSFPAFHPILRTTQPKAFFTGRPWHLNHTIADIQGKVQLRSGETAPVDVMMEASWWSWNDFTSFDKFDPFHIAVEIQLKSGTIWEFSDSWPSGSDKNHAPITQKLYRLKITAPGTPIVTDCLYDFATFQIDMYGMANVWQMYGTVSSGVRISSQPSVPLFPAPTSQVSIPSERWYPSCAHLQVSCCGLTGAKA